MSDALLPLVESVVFSPWLYAVLFALTAIDGVFPIVPSETSVITAGVFAAAVTAVAELARRLVPRTQPGSSAGHAVCTVPSC